MSPTVDRQCYQSQVHVLDATSSKRPAIQGSSEDRCHLSWHDGLPSDVDVGLKTILSPSWQIVLVIPQNIEPLVEYPAMLVLRKLAFCFHNLSFRF